MNGAYVERRGLDISSGKLLGLRDEWNKLRANNVMDQVQSFLFRENGGYGQDKSVSLISELHLGQLLFPPMWWLPTPRITSTLRYEVYDPHDMDVRSDTFGSTSFSHAYTLGLTERGFHGHYENERDENFFGSTLRIRSYEDLWGMVEKHLKMGREKRLQRWVSR